MTRADMMRAARGVVQVTFAEYLKLRAPHAATLVFEGKHCPSFYIGKVAAVVNSLEVRQLIARGKRNVLELRDLIRRNATTTDDLVLFFIDRDFDEHPEPGQLSDVYVTRGYSIENEVLRWSTIETFVRANFDVADSDDEAALRDIRAEYEHAWESYRTASRGLHKLVFVCKRAAVKCLPGDELGRFFEIDWATSSVKPRYSSMDQLAALLEVDAALRDHAVQEAIKPSPFDDLEPNLRWRGKYHFDLARKFLVRVAAARLAGRPPFLRASRIVVDPGYPGLLGALAAQTAAPGCLTHFLQRTLPAELSA